VTFFFRKEDVVYQLCRFTKGVSLLLACMLLTAACSNRKQAPPASLVALEAAPAQPSQNDFTLRIVFDGLTPFWAPNSDPNPGRILFFMGPQNPLALPIGNKMPQHVTHLLIRNTGQETITPSGRGLSRIHGFRHGEVVLTDDFMATNLDGDDVTLSGDITTALDVQGLKSVINLPKTLNSVHRGTTSDNAIKDCLTEDTISCQDFAHQLTGRITLKNGAFAPGELFSSGAKFVLADSHALSAPQPMPKNIVAVLKAHGPVMFAFRSLVDQNARGSVIVQGGQGQTVEMHIVSHPNCADELDCRQRFPDSDFSFNYDFFKGTSFAQGGELPVPKDPATLQGEPVLGTPVFNVQCSPVNLTR
jgi:hypothetical protein